MILGASIVAPVAGSSGVVQAACEVQTSVYGGSIVAVEIYGCSRIAVRGKYIITNPAVATTQSSYYWTGWKCSPAGQDPAQVTLYGEIGRTFVGAQSRGYC